MERRGMRGSGTTGVAILSANRYEESHWLLQSLVKKAGLHYDNFFYLTSEELPDLPSSVKVLVPMGEEMLRLATGQIDILRWRGRVLTPELHSVSGSTEHPDIFVLPTFAISKLLHKKRKKGEMPDPGAMRNPPRYRKSLLRDLHYAVHVAKHGFTRTSVNYLLDPSQERFAEWSNSYLERVARGEFLPLSFDIETPYKKKVVDEEELEEAEAAVDTNTLILRISFSYEPYTAVTIPWEPQYYDTIRALLASASPKIGWNFLYFDIPVLSAAGFPVNGTLYDGMDAWHFLYPQSDKGLEWVTADATDLLPWKHLSDALPEWYSAVDADAALRNVLYTWDLIRKNHAWETYETAAVEVMVYMMAAGIRGVPIDRDKQAALAPLMDVEIARLDALIQQDVPEGLKPRKRYKRQPVVTLQEGYTWADSRQVSTDGRVFVPLSVTGELSTCSACGVQGVKKADHFKGSVVEHVVTNKKGVTKVKRSRVKNPCKLAGATITKQPAMVTEWDEILPFNAGSSKQLIAYMKAHKHPVGKSKKDHEADAADAAHLKELTGMFDNGGEGKPEDSDFPLYPLSLALHDVNKARTTYMPTPDELGLIHTTYTNTPWTWRFGSRAINMQTWGKREEKIWARQARMQIIARPGWRIVQADSSSAEAVIQGWYMADAEFMATAVQSIHGWLSTKYLGWDFNPDTLKKVKAEAKSIYDGMKVAFFTLGFGGSAYGMHMSNKKLFPKKDDAQRIVDIIYELIPKLGNYHWNLRGIAQKQGFIKSPWNMRFDFFDVYTYDRDRRSGDIRYNKQGRPMLKLGKDGKAVVALLPQHSNGMFSRENAVLIGRSEWGQYMPANFAVHDSYALRVPAELEDKAAEFLLETLTRPIRQLGGLRLGAEVEAGDNWGDMDTRLRVKKNGVEADNPEYNPPGMRSIAKRVIKMDEQRFTHMPSFEAEFKAIAGGVSV